MYQSYRRTLKKQKNIKKLLICEGGLQYKQNTTKKFLKKVKQKNQLPLKQPAFTRVAFAVCFALCKHASYSDSRYWTP